MRRRLQCAVFLLLALRSLGAIGPRAAAAQDAQYWTVAYGTHAQLLGGVTIGSTGDISTTYYDPAMLALMPRTGFAVAGSAYQYEAVRYENGLGLRKELATSSVAALPSLFAGEFTIGRNNRFAYSFLTRQQLDLEIQGRNLPLDSAINSPNVTFASGTLRLTQHVGEYWGGLTWSRPFSQHFAFGLTPYIGTRSQNARFQAQAQGVGASGVAGAVDRDFDFDYTSWRVLAKIGVGVAYPHVTAGLVLTTPSARLFGSGSVGRTVTTINQGIQGTGPTPPVVAVDYQENLEATYKSPLSIGAGGAYVFGSGNTTTIVHVAAEWFDKVAAYSILSPAPFVAAAGNLVLSGTIMQQLKSVVNAGFALQHGFGESMSGYASIRTDNSAAGSAEANNAIVARWNLTHVTLGASWALSRSDFVAGTDIAFGSSTQATNSTGIAGGAPIVPAGAKVGYTSATLILGLRLGGS